MTGITLQSNTRPFKVNKSNILQWLRQSPNLNLIELKTKLKAECLKKETETAGVNDWEGITMLETKHSVISMDSRLHIVTKCKGLVIN